jgi:hypothetical protein
VSAHVQAAQVINAMSAGKSIRCSFGAIH